MKTTLAMLFVVFLACFAAPSAMAQMPCSECDPYTSSCSDSCWYCEMEQYDGYCAQQDVVQSTCGDRGLGNPGCLQDNCTPSWVVTAEENRGTYGEAVFNYSNGHIVYSCTHHRVDWITEEDVNQCNQNSGYWTKNDCIDYVDATKPGSLSYQDCCNGHDFYFNTDPTYDCNNYHACY